MQRTTIGVACAIVLVASAAAAGELAAVTVKAGGEGRVGAAWNCTNPNNIAQISIDEAPANGSITIVEQATGAPCGNNPMRVVMYKPNAGFRGQDRIAYRVNHPRSSETFSRAINVR